MTRCPPGCSTSVICSRETGGPADSCAQVRRWRRNCARLRTPRPASGSDHPDGSVRLRPDHPHSLTRRRPASVAMRHGLSLSRRRNSRARKVGQAGSSVRPGTACWSAFLGRPPCSGEILGGGVYVSAPGLDRVPARLCARSGSDESSRAGCLRLASCLVRTEDEYRSSSIT